ncbi:pectate lyase [Asticcacaulis tiandongensis]|uniref:pectate lyase n=1 Tax=Asticcacaulis tiandongensis TaxID=2565365 RepID=UPI0011292E8C|nr:pectate lyase [Asticcacaulis tiandongensis]
MPGHTLKRHLCLTAAIGLMWLPVSGQGAVIGQNVPFPPLTAERLTPDQQDWRDYLARSEAQKQADRAVLAAERKGLTEIPASAQAGNGEKTMPLNRPADWYASSEARQVADHIVSYQTPAGGWTKNHPRDAAPRQKGQAFTARGSVRVPTAGDFDTGSDAEWSYAGTIDNEATTLEIRFLMKVAAQLPAAEAKPYIAAAEKGLTYLFAAQFPNGGWPQVWPLQGGYHDGVTLNDNAMIEVISLMDEVSRSVGEFSLLSEATRQKAADSETKGVNNLLVSQVRVGDKGGLWAQQYDALTLTPASARNYEPPAISSSESAAVLGYLMSLPDPSPEIVKAVDDGVKMLHHLKIHDKVFRRVSETEGRRLVTEDGAVIWARYYDPKTLKPIFGERDKSVFDSVDDVGLERRNGYAWFSTSPQKIIDAYDAWKKTHGDH